MDVEYSSKPATLGDWIQLERTKRGDPEAILALIVSRTNLSAEAAMDLDPPEIQRVLRGIGRGFRSASILSALSKQLAEKSEATDG